MDDRLTAIARSFTREEADRMLPLVRLIVRDIVVNQRALVDRTATLAEILAAQERGEGAPADFDRRAAEQGIHLLRQALDDSLGELRDLGLLCRDPDRGIVEFPARSSASSARLGWKLGDERISLGDGHGSPLAGVKRIDA